MDPVEYSFVIMLWKVKGFWKSLRLGTCGDFEGEALCRFTEGGKKPSNLALPEIVALMTNPGVSGASPDIS